MPTKRDCDITKPAARKPRTRKALAAATATSKSASEPRKAAAKPAEKPVAPRRRAASPRKPPQKQPATVVAATEAQAEPEAPVIFSVPTPILPVSPREPAASDASSSAAIAAAPVPEHTWSWAGAPIAATVAFLATLGALLMGYWTGYSVGSDAMGKPGATVVAAAEKKPTLTIAVEPAPEQASEAAAGIEPQPEQSAAAAAAGLHLQVSALSNERAADSLRRQLEGRGFPVHIEAPKEDDLVRVYVGPIADADDLNKWSSELRNQGLKPFPKRL